MSDNFTCYTTAKNTIIFSGDIDEQSCSAFFRVFLNTAEELSGKEEKNIKIILNSNGGSVSCGLAMYELLKNYKNVEILCVGFVGSAATLLLYATDKVSSYRSTCFLVHQLYSCMQGKLSDVNTCIDLSNRYLDKVVEVYKLRSPTFTKEYLVTDRFFEANKALELGLVTSIYD